MLQHIIPEGHLKHIGDITVSFALLESIIQLMIGSLIFEHQRIGQIITAELSFKNLRSLLISLYVERHGKDDDFKVLREFMKRAAAIEDKRNQITHSIWSAGQNSNSITRIKTTAKEKHGIRFNFENVTEQDLKNVALDIKNLGEEIQNFHMSLLDKGKVINNPFA
jgi:hypothetical protein